MVGVTDMINILFLEQFSRISGGQKVLLQILKSLDFEVYNPIVVVPEQGELSQALTDMNIKYTVVPQGKYSAGRKNLFDLIKYCLFSLWLILMVFWLTKKYRINLVYANAPRTFLWGTVGAKLAGLPIVWHLHSILTGIELKLVSWLIKFGVKRIIAVSQATTTPFTKIKPSLKSNFEIIYNGLEPAKDAMIKQAEKKTIVAFIGQLVCWKGIEQYLRAACAIVREKTEVAFWVIGDVVFADKKALAYRKYLHNLVADCSGVEFLGRRADVNDLLAQIDILVIPSIKPDPCPLVLLEGMSYGKAIVAANHGGPAEIIADQVDGSLYPPQAEAELIRSLNQLIDQPVLRKQYGQAAKTKLETKFNQQVFMSKINKVLQSTIINE